MTADEHMRRDVMANWDGDAWKLGMLRQAEAGLRAARN